MSVWFSFPGVSLGLSASSHPPEAADPTALAELSQSFVRHVLSVPVVLGFGLPNSVLELGPSFSHHPSDVPTLNRCGLLAIPSPVLHLQLQAAVTLEGLSGLQMNPSIFFFYKFI